MSDQPDAEDALGDAFWRFSITLYAAPGVAERCLRLQDRDGWDVNLGLFCLWSGFQRGALEPPVLDEAAALSQAWREVAVAPLRRLRRALKSGVSAPGAERIGAEAFREEIKRVELLAEQRQQFALAPLAARATDPPGRAAAAMALFHVGYAPDLSGVAAGAGAESLKGGQYEQNRRLDVLFLLDAAENLIAEGC